MGVLTRMLWRAVAHMATQAGPLHTGNIRESARDTTAVLLYRAKNLASPGESPSARSTP